MIVLGIDPGARTTGFCLRRGDNVLAAGDVTRDRDEGPLGVGPGYCAAVLRAIAQITSGEFGRDLIAVEDVHRPNWHVLDRRGGARAAADPTALLGTAIVLGAVLGRYPSAVRVPPGRNGAGALRAYPRELVSDQERRHGTGRTGGGRLRHARSAYDVAGAGLLIHRHHLTTRKAPSR